MFEKIKDFLFKNTSTKQTVAKNTVWLTISNFGGRIIKAGLIIYAARILGTAGYGLFSYAVTLAGFFTLFMDPGVNAVLVRDGAAATEEDRKAILGTVFFIKLFLIIIGVAIIIFVAPLFSTLPGAKVLLPVVALIMTFDTLREFLLSLVRVNEKMEWETGIFLFTNLAILIFGLIFIMITPSAKALSWGYAIGTGLGAAFALYVLRDRLKEISGKFSRRLVVPIFQSAWPFAVIGALGLLLTNTDILVISWMKTASDVGIYAASIRIIQVLYLVPMIFQFSTLPVLARLANRDNEKFRVGFEKLISILFLAAIPMALGGVILGTQIMRFVYGAAYAPGGPSLKILMLTMIIDYPGAVFANAVFAYNHQRSLIVSSTIGGVSNLVLDLALIPRFGMTGSAVATLIATILSNSYLWRVMDKANRFTVIPRLKKILVVGILMGMACLSLSLLHVNVILNIVICFVLYIALLKIFREPLLTEILNFSV